MAQSSGPVWGGVVQSGPVWVSVVQSGCGCHGYWGVVVGVIGPKVGGAGGEAVWSVYIL